MFLRHQFEHTVVVSEGQSVALGIKGDGADLFTVIRRTLIQHAFHDFADF